jgi:hypothetical protein
MTRPDRTPKLPNRQRILPTVSFSLSQVQLDSLREIAYSREVSLSQIVREAIELAFKIWQIEEGGGPPELTLEPPADDQPTTTDSRGLHKPVKWPKQLRREIASGRTLRVVYDTRYEHAERDESDF